MRLAVGALVLTALVACGGTPRAPDARAAAIESQVWSPYCAGRLLTECTTSQADDLRVEILRRARSGQSDAAIVQWLRQNYGDEILAKPRAGRAGLAMWAVPFAALLAGSVLLAVLVRRWTRGSPPTPEPAPGAHGGDDEWLRKVREEVERGL